MDLHWFNDLAHLDHSGSFSRAAEMGHVSQPTLSRRIQALEGWVGVPLVDRSTQPVNLTEAGKQMLEAGQQALARLETERHQILESRAQPEKYVVTFGAQHSIGWRFYPAWLQAFEQAYGPVMSRLRADDLPNCERDLEQHLVDFVIAYSLGDADTASAPNARTRLGADGVSESLVIGHDTLVPVCKSGHDGKPLFNLSASKSKLPFLRFGDDSPLGQLLERMLRESGLGKRLKPTYENSMAGALRIRARDGSGIAWLPLSLVKPDLETGQLISYGKPDWCIPLDIRLHRRRDHINSLTRSIWTFLAIRQTVPLL
ncbi:MAG: LysR substrate-binding domain-containing protein [Pseudomonadota bacterium]